MGVPPSRYTNLLDVPKAWLALILAFGAATALAVGWRAYTAGGGQPPVELRENGQLVQVLPWQEAIRRLESRVAFAILVPGALPQRSLRPAFVDAAVIGLPTQAVLVWADDESQLAIAQSSSAFEPFPPDSPAIDVEGVTVWVRRDESVRPHQLLVLFNSGGRGFFVTFTGPDLPSDAALQPMIRSLIHESLRPRVR